MYDQENTIFIWKDASSSDEMYFAYKYNEWCRSAVITFIMKKSTNAELHD